MHYDIAEKILIEKCRDVLLEHLLQISVSESVILENLPQETVSLRRSDYPIQVTDAAGQSMMVLLELKSAWETDSILQILDYRIRHKMKHRVPVMSCIVLLTPSASATDCYQDEEVHFQYRLIRIYEMDAREIMDGNLTCMMPFVPLMRHGPELIIQAENRINDSDMPRRDRADMLTSMAILSGLISRELPKEMIGRRRDLMIESAACHNHAALYEQALDLYLDENKPDDALRILSELAKSHYTKAFGEIGVILYRENQDVEKAEEWFVKAEKTGMLLEEAAYEYGMLHYLEKDDWKTGLRYLLKAAEQGYELAYGDIGIILYEYKSDIDEAEKWFEKAVKEDALLAPAAFHYGQLLMLERDEWEKSKKYFKQAAEEEFDLAYGEYASILYLDKIDVAEAEKYFKKAEEVDCLTAPHAHNYGELLIKEKGEIEKGNRYLNLAEADGYYEE